MARLDTRKIRNIWELLGACRNSPRAHPAPSRVSAFGQRGTGYPADSAPTVNIQPVIGAIAFELSPQ